MRVAVLAHSFPRFPGDTHGPFVKRLSEEIARHGHQVHALVPYDPELAGDPDSPLTVHSFRYVWPDRGHRLGYSRTLKRDVGLKLAALLQSPLYFLFAERALARLVREQRIELIHAHWLLPNGFVARRVARRAGIPFAATLHGSDVFMAEKGPLLGAMARRALAGAAHVTSCSADLRDRLLAVGGREHADKVLLVANGTDVVPAAGEVPAAGDEPLVVAVGRLVDKKGFRYLLDAMPALLERHPAARLVLGGGGDLEQPLRRRAAELGIADRVELTGALSHPEVLALIARADVFAMPSVRDSRGNIDGLPIVVLEAMAAGKPVVASDVAGMPLAITPGVHGRLVPEKDPGALARALSGVLDDPGRARAMGEAARRRVEEELNWHAVAGVHDRLYRQAAAAGGGG